MAFQPGEIMMIFIFIMLILAVVCLFGFGRLSVNNSPEDITVSALCLCLGLALIIGAGFLTIREATMDTKDEVLRHLNLTKAVGITLDVQPDNTSEFRYKLEDSTHTDLFNYLTEEK